ncbi:hypothetical protein [Ruegeria sp. HKCCD7559]|uniref:hypothetical protein n=1 Tax=Ruegeria sp. HKCCD7559 TaxID=2683005 RepID=UPI001491A602|nr:hypothetical protein [Ruegeria sp. HKCCD7559]NOC47042.1 hypothetical protein [Ruegeria sp. HKCCD7559]
MFGLFSGAGNRANDIKLAVAIELKVSNQKFFYFVLKMAKLKDKKIVELYDKMREMADSDRHTEKLMALSLAEHLIPECDQIARIPEMQHDMAVLMRFQDQLIDYYNAHCEEGKEFQKS